MTITSSPAAGTLAWLPATAAPDLMADPVRAAIDAVPSAQVAPIAADLADTAAFCAAYASPETHSANCVVVAGRRGGEVRQAAVLVLASDRADINGVVRRHLDVRKISFAPMDQATALTGMEYGGITPVGLPEGWPVLVDERVLGCDAVVIGSGIRASKLLVDPRELVQLPAAEVLALAQT